MGDRDAGDLRNTRDTRRSWFFDRRSAHRPSSSPGAGGKRDRARNEPVDEVGGERLAEQDAPDFGGDPAFDLRFYGLQRVAWLLLTPLLLVAAVRWHSSGSAVTSTVLRTVLMYGGLLLLLRIAGKRTLGEMSTFDLVIVLLVSEGVQPALVGESSGLFNAFAIVATLVVVDVALGALKFRSKRVARWLDDVPSVLVRDGEPIPQAMKRAHVGIDDVMEAARLQHGIDRFRAVRHVILERNGSLAVLLWPATRERGRGTSRERQRKHPHG